MWDVQMKSLVTNIKKRNDETTSLAHGYSSCYSDSTSPIFAVCTRSSSTIQFFAFPYQSPLKNARNTG